MAADPDPDTVLDTFSLTDRVFLIGSLESGVTVYNQQVRAHNLAWALRECSRRPKHIAVIGGGIAGITFLTCLLSSDENVKVTMFEGRWDLCPFQQGADHRWLHPHIYSWPVAGSTAPSASLPLLNWSAGRASDVVGKMLRDFSKAVHAFDKSRLRVVLGTNHLRISKGAESVEWIGVVAHEERGFWRPAIRAGGNDEFDCIVLAAGFGLEEAPEPYSANSYWRSEHIGQPSLRGERNEYLISGYGDGALVDLCRLTIERFRSDLILEELFGVSLATAEEELNAKSAHKLTGAALVRFLDGWHLATNAELQLRARIRKDTAVWLHLAGRKENRSLMAALEGKSSFLNKVLCYLLYRCGAFTPVFGRLEEAVKLHSIPAERVLCRHGANTHGHLLKMFDDDHAERLREFNVSHQQRPSACFPPGYFRPIT